MRTLQLGTLLLLASLPARAFSQDEAMDVAVPDPPSSSDAVSDIELLRWAANEVRLHEGRPAASHPPVPPDSYVGAVLDPTGLDGIGVLPGSGLNDAVRIMAELGGGTLGLLVGASLGALIMWGAVEGGATPTWMMVAVGASTAIGAMGVTAGVVLAADATGGQGNFGHAFIGQLMGTAAALPLVTLGMANDLPALAVIAVSILPLAGAMFGYEISHGSRGGGMRQLAFVRPTLGGAEIGVAGEL